jgi:hypothetical protein
MNPVGQYCSASYQQVPRDILIVALHEAPYRTVFRASFLANSTEKLKEPSLKFIYQLTVGSGREGPTAQSIFHFVSRLRISCNSWRRFALVLG